MRIKLKKKIRILTYHHITNNGAALFSYSLQQLLSDQFENAEVKILDYHSPNLAFYEYLKFLKLHKKAPAFYLQRHQQFRQFSQDELDLDRNFSKFNPKSIEKYLLRENFNLLIPAMDVWNIANIRLLPKFPNVYWLPRDYQNPAVAFAVSAYRSDRAEVARTSLEICSKLSRFNAVGTRDAYTYQLVNDHMTNENIPVVQVPDPTFVYESKQTEVGEKMGRMGIDVEKPILGIMMFGKNYLVRILVDEFKRRGYQIVALSMYNQEADYNLGHVLNPHEWAAAFQYLTFCITDRFHGNIFCLINDVPFVTVEPDLLQETLNSKILDLLSEFDLTRCYVNPHSQEFDIRNIISTIDKIQKDWPNQYSSKISGKIIEMQTRLHDYCGLIKGILDKN